ncbi:MAG: response regulator [Pyrinomonadaceae bacterium]
MSKRKLLLADDSITIQKVVNLTFADEGIDVVTVGDGDAALARLEYEIPDILLADVNMPGPTGYEICERLRANEATRNVPVILLVGSFEPFDEAEATRVGANAYLTKPFQSIKQLIAQVNELMDAASAAAPERSSDDSAPIAAAPVIEEIGGSPFTGESEAVDVVGSEPRRFDDLGYQVLTPVGGTPAGPADVPDDIDSLYQRSTSGEPNDDLSDVGIDDEMIETSYSAAQANDELAAFESESNATAESHEARAEAELEAEPEAAPEQVLETSGEQISESSETETGFRSGYEQRFPDDPSKFENTISFDNWQPADMRDGDGEPQTKVDGGNERAGAFDTAPLSDPEPQAVEATPQTAPVGEDTIRMEGRFDTTGSSSFKFDDVDLLDLSTSPLNPVEITSPVNAIEQGGNKQVVTISPELIEMIAQRVVEKLSKKY